MYIRDYSITAMKQAFSLVESYVVKSRMDWLPPGQTGQVYWMDYLPPRHTGQVYWPDILVID